MRLVGDPNSGGATRKRLVTGYRQEALRCLALLQQAGPTKASEVARQTAIAHARRLMSDNHYGWFERMGAGIYALSPKGVSAIEEYAAELESMAAARPPETTTETIAAPLRPSPATFPAS